jgi:DNA repair exonuclease SbcCD ATPase subunit
MNALFVALGIMVLALLALLLWFVPHLLQQQAKRVAGETSQLREMLLDLLNEQEAVTMRQTQLSSSLAHMQDQLEMIAQAGNDHPQPGRQAFIFAETSVQHLEARLSELQNQIQGWAESRHQGAHARNAQDNESWAYLMSLLGNIQERVGTLSQDRASAMAGLQAGALLEELEQEMQNLRSISEEIAMLQWRLRRSLHERETNLSVLRAHTSNGAS